MLKTHKSVVREVIVGLKYFRFRLCYMKMVSLVTSIVNPASIHGLWVIFSPSFKLSLKVLLLLGEIILWIGYFHLFLYFNLNHLGLSSRHCNGQIIVEQFMWLRGSLWSWFSFIYISYLFCKEWGLIIDQLYIRFLIGILKQLRQDCKLSTSFVAMLGNYSI